MKVPSGDNGSQQGWKAANKSKMTESKANQTTGKQESGSDPKGEGKEETCPRAGAHTNQDSLTPKN